MYNFAGDYIYASSDLSPKNKEVCDKMAISLLSSSIKMFGLEFFALNLACLGPVFKIFIKNEKELIVPAILPFNDPDTDKGYIINFLSELPLCAIGVILVPSTDLFTCVLKNNISVSAAIIKNSLQEFSEIFEESDVEFSAEHSLRFRNIILKIMDFNRLVKTDKFNSRDSIFIFC